MMTSIVVIVAIIVAQLRTQYGLEDPFRDLLEVVRFGGSSLIHVVVVVVVVQPQHKVALDHRPKPHRSARARLATGKFRMGNHVDLSGSGAFDAGHVRESPIVVVRSGKTENEVRVRRRFEIYVNGSL